MTAVEKRRVAVLISGRGSNMEALYRACTMSDHPAEIIAVLSDRSDAAGLEFARSEGLVATAVPRSGFSSKAEHEAAMLSALDEARPDFVCLAGYMRLLSADFVDRFSGRMINIHPSLLPLYPGLDTHQRALDAGALVHGCSVHFVTAGMDEGPVLAQAVVPVLPTDDSSTLAARVLKAEHRLYPHALRLLASGAARMDKAGRVQLSGDIASDGDALLISPGHA
ncbi:phosphoribosylglycinamide formyltransferase [Pararhizobium haloflavum]|uniref:phosphoribosylglycinamide formyltransferase n=1 Tax=Pararhizobium haloflavum TaxID=2037914 RepID=UPI001FDF8966|nr:phosphoribosylglycinamide formyltransferase [Pararhizobium haloflavum]